MTCQRLYCTKHRQGSPMTLNATFTPPRNLPLAAKAGGGFRSEGYVEPAPSGFTALMAEDYSGSVAGNTSSEWSGGGLYLAEYSDVRAKTGMRSVKLSTRPSASAPTCGGDVLWASPRAFLENIPVGATVWQRIYHYIPSEFSMGYAFGSGDSAEASTCGSPTDGGLMNMKWMRMAPDVGTARIYLQPYVSRRQVSQPANAGIRVITEATAQQADHTSVGLTGAPFPRDQWFALQMAVKVSKTGDGFIRGWIDDQLVAEITGISTIAEAANALINGGLGSYWNGQPWTDGQSGREDFWVDEFIVATDLAGYGAPTGVDSFGNAYIDPLTTVGDLA